jgi:hypothetical protein
MAHLQCRMARRGHTGPSHYRPCERHSRWGSRSSRPVYDSCCILAARPPDWLFSCPLAAALCHPNQAPEPPLPQADGSYAARPMQYLYQPFTTTDLLNWQQHTPEYSEEPQAVIELLTNIMHNLQHNWDDCRQLMSTLLTTDERQ